MKNLFIKSLFFLLAYNIFSYGMETQPDQTKEEISKMVTAIYNVISAVQRNNVLDQNQKNSAFKQLKEQANQLMQSATPLSASLETRCRNLLEHLNEALET